MGIGATLERSTFHPDGCELSCAESLIMAHALMSAHNVDVWECYRESGPVLTFPIQYESQRASAGNEFHIPLMRPSSSPLRQRHKPIAIK